jgi:hypothetical protein
MRIGPFILMLLTLYSAPGRGMYFHYQDRRVLYIGRKKDM